MRTGHSLLRLLAAAAAILATAPAAFAADAAQMEANKKAVVEFLDQAINQKNFDAAAAYLGPRYIQHNPNAGDGPEGLKGYIAFLRQKFPDYHSDMKRVLADGDFVVTHAHNAPTPGARGSSVMNIFKLENGKIVEHWDAIQDVPEKSLNANTMF